MHVHRVVAEEQRTLGLGLLSLISKLGGAIPGPLIVGHLFDVTCEYWQYECGERGNCWVYDNQTLAYYVFGYAIVVLGACTILNTATWLTYPKNKDQGDTVRKHSEDNVTSSTAV